MKLAVYTLTRDRLAYTKLAFQSLHEKAGIPFDHFVIDQGSQDVSRHWLEVQQNITIKFLTLLDQNWGISAGTNLALDQIEQAGDYDLVVKFDNDCLVQTENLLARMVQAYQDLSRDHQPLVLGPKVNGLRNNQVRLKTWDTGHETVSRVAIVGGICQMIGGDLVKVRLPGLKMAWGQDDFLSDQVNKKGGLAALVESCEVEHMETTDGQFKRFPEYFERKWAEEKMTGFRKVQEP